MTFVLLVAHTTKGGSQVTDLAILIESAQNPDLTCLNFLCRLIFDQERI